MGGSLAEIERTQPTLNAFRVVTADDARHAAGLQPLPTSAGTAVRTPSRWWSAWPRGRALDRLTPA